MKESVKALMNEAVRRYCMFHAGEPLSQAWIGLGYITDYRPAIKEGLMQWVDGDVPYRRCMGWIMLTPKGEKEFLTIVARYLRAQFFEHGSMRNSYELWG